MKILPVQLPDTQLQKELDCLIAACDGYMPYIQEDDPVHSGFILQYAAFYENKMVGFLSCLVFPAASASFEAEVTALVAPAFRRQGVFTALLAALKIRLLPENIRPVCAVPPEFFAGRTPSFGPVHAYTEFLMQYHPDYAGPALRLPACTPAEYECCFSDDRCDYLLYAPDAEEPSAVCSLDYQPAFTNLYGVFVDEHTRRKGLGTLLMQNLIRDYFQSDTRPLVLNVRSSNTAAYRLYQKCGFTEASRIDYYFI